MSSFSLRSAIACAPFEPPVNIFQHLKESTSGIHRQLEERMPVFHPGFSRADYTRLVEAFYGFWAPLEIKLSLLKALEHTELDLAGRLKSSLLEKDLRVLGCEPGSVPRCDNLPVVDSLFRGLGCLYVLEGSTLGARIISPRIANHLQLTDGAGASFFNAYGESVGQRWNAFKSFVTSCVTAGDTEEIVTAARQTFQCFFEWLGARLFKI